jgi:hypothetical protein
MIQRDEDLLRELVRLRRSEAKEPDAVVDDGFEDLPFKEVEPLPKIPRQKVPPLNQPAEIREEAPNYVRRAPVQSGVRAAKVWDRIKQSDLRHLTLGDLLGLSPGLQAEAKKDIATKQQNPSNPDLEQGAEN